MKRPRLEPDLAAALRALGAEATEVTPIAGLRSPASDRATLRVTLGDGRIVKARRFTAAERASRHARLRRQLASLPFPVLLVRRGRITIEEWVPGTPLADLARSRHRLGAAAELLARLHAVADLGARRLLAPASTARFVTEIDDRAGRLARAGAIARVERRELSAQLRRLAPARAVAGVIHRDFCAENLVEDAAGRLWIVDGGGLRVGFLEHDLGRSWYRWPMPVAAWHAFEARYRAACAPPRPAGDARFWRLAAVVESAHYRVTRRYPGAEIPLARLRELLAAVA